MEKIIITDEQVKRAKRRVISERIKGISVDFDDLTGSLSSIRSFIDFVEEEATNKGYRNVTIEEDRRGALHSYEIYFDIYGERDETDGEVRKRLMSLAMKKIKTENKKVENEKREREQLKRLMNKYGVEVKKGKEKKI